MDKNKIFKLLFIIVLIIFIISYAIEKSGYYEYNLHNKSVMTSEAMKKFEEDVKNGKNVTVEDYITDSTTDYTTTLSHNTNKFSLGVNKVLKKGIEKIFKVIGSFVEN